MNTQNTTSSTRRFRFGRAAVVAGVAVTAFAAAAATGPAYASRPADGPGPKTITASQTVSTPCFSTPTPDRWGAEAGQVPRCTHAYGTTESFGTAFAAQTTRSRTAEAQVRNHWDICFTNARSYRTWTRVQVGMPRCDQAYGESKAFPVQETHPQQSPAAVDSHCFMNPTQWDVASAGGVPVCTVP